MLVFKRVRGGQRWCWCWRWLHQVPVLILGSLLHTIGPGFAHFMSKQHKALARCNKSHDLRGTSQCRLHQPCKLLGPFYVNPMTCVPPRYSKKRTSAHVNATSLTCTLQHAILRMGDVQGDVTLILGRQVRRCCTANERHRQRHRRRWRRQKLGGDVHVSHGSVTVQ